MPYDPQGVKLAGQWSDALIAFARTGSPGTHVAAWPAFDVPRRATMAFDRQSGVIDDPDAELRAGWTDMPMAGTVFG